MFSLAFKVMSKHNFVVLLSLYDVGYKYYFKIYDRYFSRTHGGFNISARLLRGNN